MHTSNETVYRKNTIQFFCSNLFSWYLLLYDTYCILLMVVFQSGKIFLWLDFHIRLKLLTFRLKLQQYLPSPDRKSFFFHTFILHYSKQSLFFLASLSITPLPLPPFVWCQLNMTVQWCCVDTLRHSAVQLSFPIFLLCLLMFTSFLLIAQQYSQKGSDTSTAMQTENSSLLDAHLH